MEKHLVLHRADSRGLADHGWLHSHHTFSFADYYDVQRMNFGLLRVLNDDVVAPSMGFATHPHANMEIVSIPLSGAIKHQDSMGNQGVVTAGEVQIMSAGSGLTHSEFNASDREELNFLQIWVLPKQQEITPRYGQKQFNSTDRQNRFQTLVAPEKAEESIWINQHAWFSLADLDAGASITYQQHRAQNGSYFFLIDGELRVAENRLTRRDGLGVTGMEQVEVQAPSAAQLLVIEVPMAA